MHFPAFRDTFDVAIAGKGKCFLVIHHMGAKVIMKEKEVKWPK